MLALLSDEGAAGRLVPPPAPEPPDQPSPEQPSDPAPEPPVEAAVEPAPTPPSATTIQPVPGVAGELPGWRHEMSPAQYAAQPPPPSNRGKYETESQTVRAFSHVTQALRMSWLEAKRNNIMLSYTEHASRVIALGLAAQEGER